MFERLDYLYMPSRDVAADLAYFEDVLGARVVFAIDGMGTRVAMLELAGGEAAAAPRILLAGHLEGDAPVLVYRVPDLDAAVGELRSRGWSGGHALEIPQGPVHTFTAPGGQRIALYELTRPGVVESSFEGRRDF